MNIPKYIDVFAKEMKRRNYRDNSIKNYCSNLTCFLSYFEKKEHPLHLNEGDIKDYLGRFTESNTQRSHHGAIKLFYDICLNQKDKFKWIPYAKKSKHLPIVLSQEEVQKMFDACENLKHKVILSILYACGLRVSELINLKWQNIDRSRMIINILHAKGGKDRQVMLPVNLIPLLEKYYHEYKPDVYVLNGQFKDQYSARSVGEVMKQLAAKAGINKRVYTHLMRHNSFTHMVEAGVDINLIQRLAGHSSVKTTNIYLHTSHNLIAKIQSPLSNIKL
jgi:site-specific recombinase XerD